MKPTSITPTVAVYMLASPERDQFMSDLVDGKYKFDEKYIKKRRRIRWNPWPHIATDLVVSDGVHTLTLTDP